VTGIREELGITYSIAPYASVQKSVNTFGGSGESIMRCVKRMPIIPSAGSVYAVVPKPPVNIVLVAEGEEEIASPHFSQVVHRPEVLAALSKCHEVFMPFASQSPQGGVEIALGAKGVVEVELVAATERWGRGARDDIHSSYKAELDSAVWRMVKALSTLVSEDGNDPAIDGWFEHVKPLTERQKQIIAAKVANTKEADVQNLLGAQHWVRDLSYRDALERLASQPTVNIEGMYAGYTGPGGKTVLPSKATAKLDMRLVLLWTTAPLSPPRWPPR
jgi:acetylornithine deacetylase/succinyl-diaminopimelate desuccinylase-like protein